MPRFDAGKFKAMPLAEALRCAGAAARTGKDALVEARSIYKVCLSQKLDVYARGKIRQRLWEVERRLGDHPLYFSQAGQDRFVHHTFFKNRKDGVFVEIGAYNGWQGSNCLFFESSRNWSGVIVEASPRMAREIARFRGAEVVHAAISDHDGSAEFIEITSGFTQMGGLAKDYIPGILEEVRKNPRHAERAIEIPTMRLATLLEQHDLRQVDYCSIDVEGAERSILAGFDFAAFEISVFSVENNSGDHSLSVRDLMAAAGYRFVDVIGADEIYHKRAASGRPSRP